MASRTRRLADITTIVVHCTGTEDGVDRAWDLDPKKHRNARLLPIEQAVDSWHHQNGWDGIGYHGLVRVDGRLCEGRAIEVVGAHCPGHNRTGFGFCLVGRRRYSAAQWAALAGMVDALELRLGRQLHVVGHNEVDLTNKPPKDCPGFDVQAWLRGGRQPLHGHIWTLDGVRS